MTCIECSQYGLINEERIMCREKYRLPGIGAGLALLLNPVNDSIRYEIPTFSGPRDKSDYPASGMLMGMVG